MVDPKATSLHFKKLTVKQKRLLKTRSSAVLLFYDLTKQSFDTNRFFGINRIRQSFERNRLFASATVRLYDVDDVVGGER